MNHGRQLKNKACLAFAESLKPRQRSSFQQLDNSAMHRCLFIYELVHEIFEYAGATSLAPLASLARTCTHFREPALDILWRELDDFSPLVKCMPTIVWREETLGDDSSTVTLVSRLACLFKHEHSHTPPHSVWSRTPLAKNGNS